ncbi:RND efflux system, outer membrane lipoprotein,NodT family precursor [Candidatus Glomeribacter gigasporarum BEG34]|uniref:RND efflux system, outer membrane lipoprotein,NodT family n=2 Tax=Candidatus Glomeribacter gigasporarum TaxID=132144 RepID=G2J7V2_9BURK|nr:RND efflux system, outer membrane lipoprotein,NodT family precursor [Candidatus Glomeribacter gigasporarum BEG34]
MRMNRIAPVLIALMLLAGCARARWTPPSIEVPPRWSAPVVNQAATEQARAAWWMNFNDPQLNALIDEALKANNDLAVAVIRVQRARLQAGLANTTLTPDVKGVGLNTSSRNLDSHNTKRSANVSGSLSYELDLWGKLAQQRATAAWEAQAAEADRAQAALNLIGTTAELYWKLVRLNEQIIDGNADLKQAQKILELVNARYAAGVISGLDRVQAEQNVSAQRLALTRLYQQRIEARHALAVLLNRPPSYAFEAPEHLPDSPPPEVEAGLPAQALKRRPDLRVAELRLRQSFADIEKMRASFYPAFTLTGSLGSASEALLRVLQNPVATLGIGLTLPFIEWNTMQLKIKVSKSEYAEAVVHFRKNLYTALAEVENALSRRAQLIEAAAHQAQIAFQASQAEQQTHARFNAGAADLQAWLEAQGGLRKARDALKQNRLDQLNNRMRLYQALGG